MKKEKEDYKDIRIGKVSLVNGGMKGLKVEYQKVEEVQGREYSNQFNPTMKYPVHQELLDCFGWLRGHVLGICGYDRNDEVLLNALEVTGVTAGGNGFVITAKLEVYENGKVVSLVTPLTVNEEEYGQFQDVIKIIDGVYAETKVYLEKSVVMQDKQFVLNFFEKNRAEKELMGFDAESFKKLPETEQIEFATALLKKKKMIVIHEEELEIADFTGLNELSEEEKKDQPKPKGKLIEPIIEVNEESEEEDIFEEEKEIEEDGEDFNLNVIIEEPALSTAKRKTV